MALEQGSYFTQNLAAVDHILSRLPIPDINVSSNGLLNFARALGANDKEIRNIGNLLLMIDEPLSLDEKVLDADDSPRFGDVLPSTFPETAAQAVLNSFSWHVRTALGKTLSAKEQAVAMARYGLELSNEEVADLLGYTLNQVRYTLSAARPKLKGSDELRLLAEEE